MIKLRRMSWVGHVARVGDSRGAYMAFYGKMEERNHLEDVGLNGMMLLK
jgi:hypothetical protein